MSDSDRKRNRYVGEWVITVGAIVTVLSLLGGHWFNEARQQETCLREGGRWDSAKHQCDHE